MPKDMKDRLKVLRKKLGISQQHVMREGVEIALQRYERLLAEYEAEKE
jgi:predicted DNA-binding protein